MLSQRRCQSRQVPTLLGCPPRVAYLKVASSTGGSPPHWGARLGLQSHHSKHPLPHGSLRFQRRRVGRRARGFCAPPTRAVLAPGEFVYRPPGRSWMKSRPFIGSAPGTPPLRRVGRSVGRSVGRRSIGRAARSVGRSGSAVGQSDRRSAGRPGGLQVGRAARSVGRAKPAPCERARGVCESATPAK